MCTNNKIQLQDIQGFNCNNSHLDRQYTCTYIATTASLLTGTWRTTIAT